MAEHIGRDRRTAGDRPNPPKGESLFRCMELDPTQKGGICGERTIGSSNLCKTHLDAMDGRSAGKPGDWRPGPGGTGHGMTAGSYPGKSGIGLYQSCEHKAERPALTLSTGKVLYGAQGAKLHPSAVGHLDLILDCAGLVTAKSQFVKSRNARFRSLNQLAYPDVVTLNWPDMTAPSHIGIRFWSRLLEMLPQSTCVACVGGHGRTGTALASLLVADGMDPEKAIVEVRTKHCRKAIETPAQEAYIKSLGAQQKAIGQ